MEQQRLTQQLNQEKSPHLQGFFSIAGQRSNLRSLGYEPILGMLGSGVGSDDLALLGIRLLLDLAMSWDGVGHVCTLFALSIDYPPTQRDTAAFPR